MERHHFETRAVPSLVHRGEDEARRIIGSDKEVNDLQIDIDDRVVQ